MNTVDPQYLQLLNKLVTKMQLTNLDGDDLREDRTAVGTVSLFGEQMRFNLAMDFPILTTKKVHFPSVVSELLWFLKGDTNIKYLLEHNNHIWTDWRLKKFNEFRKSRNELPVERETFERLILKSSQFEETWGDIGKGYGYQWRNFGEVTEEQRIPSHGLTIDKITRKGFDQISWVINEIKTNPMSRRLIVSSWNPHDVDKVDLPPCHNLFQFFVEPMNIHERVRFVLHKMPTYIDEYCKLKNIVYKDGDDITWFTSDMLDHFNVPSNKLSCQLYQRSADIFLGVPFNIASYALLTNIIAKECNLGLGDFIWTGGDVHLYSNHLDQALEQCNRTYEFDTPKLKPFVHKPFDQYEPSDFELIDYQHHPAIKAPVAV